MPWFDRYAPWLVALVPLLLYLPALRLGFVYFDDDILLLINREKIGNLANLGRAFSTDAFFSNMSPYYRPLQTVSFMLEAAVGGTSPAIYHFGNVLLHTLTCLALWRLLNLLGLGRGKALVGTLFYAVHPMAGQAALWIPARGDLMVTLFGLLSFSALIDYSRNGKAKDLAVHAIAFAAAIFSKESGALLPFMFGSYMLFLRGKAFRKQDYRVWLVWLAVGALWYLLRYNAIEHRSDGQVGFHAVAGNLPFLPETIARFFFPFGLSVAPVFSPFLTLAGAVAALGLVIYVIAKPQKGVRFLILFGTLWFIAFSLPNMFVRLNSAADSWEYLNHRTYLPYVGLLVMVLAAIPAGWVDLSLKPARYIVPGVLLLLGGFSLVQQNRYENGITFWGSALQEHPERSWFHYYMGRYYFKHNDNATYEKYLQEAEALKSYPEFKYQLGMIAFADRKDYEKAYDYFTKAFREGYGDPEGRANFIALCLESSADRYSKGDFEGAVSRCREAVINDPENADAAYNLGLYLVNAGKKQEAALMWQRAISLNPGLTGAYRSLCLYYRYDAKRADSANWYAREYLRHGGTENLVSP